MTTLPSPRTRRRPAASSAGPGIGVAGSLEQCMRIAIDAMGGDLAPEETVAGALLAAERLDADLSLAGDPEAIGALLGDGHLRVEIEPASDVIQMGESPREALRGREDSSVARAVQLVVDGRAQAVVSAGNSGAFMALSALRMGTIAGVARPAIAVTFPTPHGKQVILDVGANADCKPEYLRDFALMGSIYAERTLGINPARVGLLSVGEEDGKGNELTKAAHPLLEEADIEFVGNVEGTDILSDACDVVVCDGFVGNVVLKTAERAAQTLLAEIGREVKRSFALRLMAVPLRAALRNAVRGFDYSQAGGALLLGVKGVAIVCHGRSDASAISNAIAVAHRAVEHGLVEHLAEVFAQFEDVEA